jgi:hypothetical protein
VNGCAAIESSPCLIVLHFSNRAPFCKMKFCTVINISKPHSPRREITHVFGRALCRGLPADRAAHVEEKLVELQQQRRDLAEAVVAADDRLLSRLTADDLRLLLS